MDSSEAGTAARQPLRTPGHASGRNEHEAYAAGVAHGRHEERLRLAQDLHDDIGARLLTLMFRARDPVLVESLRQTIRELKSWTHGLAMPRQQLSQAVADWGSDARYRLQEAGIALSWQFTWDQDATLRVEQWSALSRVLRELVSNVLAHADARRVWVDAQVRAGRLHLNFEDDGHGAPPQTWSSGLGCAGIRRRAHDLGGEVRWQGRAPHGVRCVMDLPLAKESHPAGGAVAGPGGRASPACAAHPPDD